ncbi:MAG: methyltransferase domain-containing protein [Betaproteobacteria bacterium]|nr:methyltransferase domain-containing protein [Betaproteobacteria bacterium]MDE2131651.1 methyltransferase domain-containing protein [Betaproteobacteria bacterium]MDE2211164.1 methyltransferase domain-containing protein [Betaproteobacteria bacterium]
MANATLHDWLETPLGSYVLGREQLVLDEAVSNIFGFNALQVFLPELDALRANRIPNKITVSPNGDTRLLADPAALPIATQSIDLAVLPHALEFSPNPHAILREMDRVMMPEGRLVITGFNPRSLWGVRRFMSRSHGGYPWSGQFVALSRLKDWLALLGFEVNAGRFWAYAPPFATERLLHRFRFMELAGDRWWGVGGGVYMLQAIKRVQGARLITPCWNRAHADKALASAVRTAVRRSGYSGQKVIPLMRGPRPPEEPAS